MDAPGPGWIVFTEEEPAMIMEAMRTSGHIALRDDLVRFILALAIEAGAAAEAGRPLPGLPMGDTRYNLEVPGAPVLISYGRVPGVREFRITDLIWLHTGD